MDSQLRVQMFIVVEVAWNYHQANITIESDFIWRLVRPSSPHKPSSEQL